MAIEIQNLDDLENTVHELHDQMLLVSDGIEAVDFEQATSSFQLAQDNMAAVRVYLEALTEKKDKK